MAKAEQMLVAPAAAGGHSTTRATCRIAPRRPGAARARALQARRRLHGQGRRGRHRRRVHRPPDAGPPLERRPAPGGRGQGEGEDRAREPDARDHHLPELLPQVQEALRHDRHGRHRGGGVRQDLQARRHRHPAQPAAARASRTRTSSTAPSARSGTRSSPTSSRSRRRAGRCSSARSRSRSRSALLDAAEARAASSTSCSTRSTTRRKPRSSRRPAARAPSRSPRTWPAAAPTSCSAATPSSWRGSSALAEQIAERLPKGEERFVDDDEFVYFFHLDALLPRAAGRLRAHLRALQGADRRRARGGRRRSAACTSSAPSGTRRGASTTSCAAAPAARAIPGSSRFYLSLEDDLMRIFGSDRISGLMQRLGMEEGVPIEHGMVTSAIERAQKQVEAQNFAVRKHLLEYDDVMNKQRENVYALRREILEGKIHVDRRRGRRHARLPDGAGRGPARRPRRDATPAREADVEEWDLDGAQARGRRECSASTPTTRRARLRRAGRRRDRATRSGTRVTASYDEKEQLVGRRAAAARRARHHAADRRRAVEGSPLQPRPPEGRHRPARLRPARSARRVQEGKLRSCSRR